MTRENGMDELLVDSAATRGTKPVVLVVDDEYLTCAQLVDALLDRFGVVEARSGDQAVEVLRTTPVDVVVTDRRMPGSIDGDALAELVAEQFPSVPVLMMSGEWPAPCETLAIAEFFSKPIDVKAVVTMVARLVAHRSEE